MRTTYTYSRVVPFLIERRRPDGTAAEVEDLRVKWQRLHDLGPGGPAACGHNDECEHYLERNAAVNEARERVSQRQEGQVFRGLTVYSIPGPLDGIFDRLQRRRPSRRQP
jgi:hypothetical protein